MFPVTVSETSEPAAYREASALIVRSPLIVELAATESEPPVIASGSLHAIELTTACVAESIVTVGLAPFTSITTSSLGPGTWPVLQLAGSAQSPLLVEIQLTVARRSRFSSPSRTRNRRWRLAGEIDPELEHETDGSA